jgi:non-specific serine/threonine protein kinase
LVEASTRHSVWAERYDRQLEDVFAIQDADEATRHLQTAVALRPGDANTLYNAACTYGVLGKKAEALETLHKAFAAGYGNRNWAAKDSDFECLRDDPEFQKLVGLSKSSAS